MQDPLKTLPMVPAPTTNPEPCRANKKSPFRKEEALQIT